MHYKLNIKQLSQVQKMNEAWIKDYKQVYPQDKITTAYATETMIDGNYYLIKDSVTELYITDYMAIVNELPIVEPETE